MTTIHEPSGTTPNPSVPDAGRDAVAHNGVAATHSQFGPAAGDATPEAPEANVQGGIPVGANASLSGVTSSGGENPAPNSDGELDAGNDASAPDDSGSVGVSTSDTAATLSSGEEKAVSAGDGAVPVLAAEGLAA